MGKLTFQKINHAKPREKQYKLADGLGLNLLVKPNGSKLWQGKYRFGGKEKTHSMGVFPEVSISDARAAWKSTRRELKNGTDPSVARKKAKLASFTISENTFHAVAEDWFVIKLSDKSKGHRDREYGILKNHLSPALGCIPLEDINAQVLLDAIRKVEANGTLNAAHRALRVAGAVFRYGVAIGKCSRDPSGDLKGALKPHKTKHRAAIIDPKPFGVLLAASDAYQGSPTVMAALRLMPILFLRTKEMRFLTWDMVNWEQEQIEAPAEIMKMPQPHIIPLSRQALRILENLQQITGDKPFVFYNRSNNSRVMSENALLNALRAMGFEPEQMSVHGFRASARTMLDEQLGFPPHIVEQQLAHAVQDATGRAYNRTKHLKERKAMMQNWADYLDRLKADAIGFRVVG